jgi:hypothetical protein
VPVTYIVHTQVDPEKSDGDVISMQQTKCMATTSDYCIDGQGDFVLEKDDPAIVNIGIDKFALDRRTGLPVADQGKFVTDAAEVADYAGVVAKFPFDTQKKDYDYWDGTLGKAVTAEYKGTKKIDGLETYRFEVNIPTTDAEVAEGTQGTYAAKQTVWVDPATGAFVDQEGSQTVALPDGTRVLDVSVSYTDATVKNNVATAKSNGRSLFLMGTVARFGAPILGLLLIGLGIFLLRRRSSGSEAPPAHVSLEKQPV